MANSKPSNVLRDTFQSLRYILSFSIMMSLVYGLLKLAGPLFMILIFDRVLPSRSGATLVSLLLLLIIIIAVMTLLDYSRRRILARFGAQFQERIEDHIFSSMGRDAYFARGGTKPAAGLNDVDQLRGFFHSGSLITILDFLWCPVFLAVVVIISPLIGAVVVVGIALLAIINTIKNSSDKGREERQSAASDRVGELKDTLLVSRHVIESQQMMGTYNKRWVMARRVARDSAVELKDRSAWFSILSSHTALLIRYTALAAGAYMAIKGEITIGAMVASMYLARYVLNPTERFLRQLPTIREAIGNWKSLDRTLSTARSPIAIHEGAAVLRLTQLMVRCPITRNKLLRNINVDISPGMLVEIVGGPGSGKTVLAETLIGRFSRAGGNGSILLGAIDIERLTIADAAKTFGYIPQRIDLISGTIEENIAGLDTDTDRERLVHVARLAQIHDKIICLPEGYLTRIDSVGSIFSKSERYQLALARALYPDPNVLIVDEPDAAFADALSGSLQNEITDFLARGGILIVLTSVALNCYRPTRRFTLDEGVLKEERLQISDRKPFMVQNG